MPILLRKIKASIRRAFTCLVFVFLFTQGQHLVRAQELEKELGFGVLVGPISGISAKARFSNRDDLPQKGPNQSVDLNFSTNLDDYALWSAHVLAERTISNSPLTSYLGPGLQAGIDKKSVFWGLSSEIGLLFQKGPYEVFLQGMPRLFIVPEFNGRFEAATGIRIFF